MKLILTSTLLPLMASVAHAGSPAELKLLDTSNIQVLNTTASATQTHHAVVNSTMNSTSTTLKVLNNTRRIFSLRNQAQAQSQSARALNVRSQASYEEEEDERMELLLVPTVKFARTQWKPNHQSRRLTPEEYRRSLTDHEKEVIDFWTPERRAGATPMELRTMEDPSHPHARFLQDLVNDKGEADDVEEGDGPLNFRWEGGGTMEQASGRIFMVFDENAFSCSGTVVRDLQSPDRTLIATAAHCIYNEMRRYWAHDFLFIPNQDDGGKDESNRKCEDDPFGCWIPSFGVVDTDWAKNLNNIPHDFGFLVVPNKGAHEGNGGGLDIAMEEVVKTVTMDLTDKMGLKDGDIVTAMGLPGFEENELRYATGDVKIWQDLLFVHGGGLTEGASGGSIISEPDSDSPTLIGFNVFKAGWWKEEEDGTFKFIQTACGGPALWGNSFCSLVHVAENAPLDDERTLERGGIIHEYDGSQCVLPGVCGADSDCDDGQFCNGIESCLDGQCVADTSGPCRAEERCDEKKDTCLAPCSKDSQCNDGNFCNGIETCEEGQCVEGPFPCASGEYCDPFKNKCEEVQCVSDFDCDDGRYCSGEEKCMKGQCVAGFYPCDKRGGEICVEEIEACPLATCSGVPDFCIDEYQSVCCHCIKHCNEPNPDTVVIECAPELFWPKPYAGFRNPPMCWTLMYPPGNTMTN